ncbi:MAG: hypothetical protein Q9227_006181 [Pyrenula ochraceoflavens]
MSPTISVFTPNGTATISNPLYVYRFPSAPTTIPGMENDFEADYLHTVRHPTTGDSYGGKGQQQDDMANSAMVAQSSTLHSGIYQLFSQPSPYNDMACDSDSGQSIEALHDQRLTQCFGFITQTLIEYMQYGKLYIQMKPSSLRCVRLTLLSPEK